MHALLIVVAIIALCAFILGYHCGQMTERERWVRRQWIALLGVERVRYGVLDAIYDDEGEDWPEEIETEET